MNQAIGIQLLLGPRPITSLEEYLAGGGGEGLARALELGPDQVIAEGSLAGLRGRGGAGVPPRTQWASVQSGGGRHHYAVCNAAEGEPATFKDRALLRANPYQVVEGLAIAALAVDAREAFVALKASFRREQEATERAMGQMREAGLLGEMLVGLLAGPEEYLFGEEKALLEVIEGNDPLPRWLPPSLHGLFATVPQLGWEAHDPEQGHLGAHYANPTLVNNVETLANVPHILAKGAGWFRSMGTGESPGTVVCTVVGDVRRPDVVEVELGTELGEVLDHCGGPPPGRRIPAVLSGGCQPVLPPYRGATPHLEHPGRLSRGLRRPSRRPLPPPARGSRAQDRRPGGRQGGVRPPPGQQAPRLDLRRVDGAVLSLIFSARTPANCRALGTSR